MPMRTLRHRLALSAFPLWIAALGACGTDAMGTDACRKIEQARCRKAPACPDLSVQAGAGVEECAQFARDRCLHGLAVADPGLAVVDQCVSAIDHSASCDAIASPESMMACAFLLPSPVMADAGSDVMEAATATPDAAASTPADASTDAEASTAAD